MTKVLIIEDEEASSDYLVKLLSESSLIVKVLSIITSVEDSINWFSENDHPDIIFMDVQLSDGQSFEIFNNIKVLSPVIFVTAHDEYAIHAFKTTGIDYLLKPISKLDLNNSLNKYFENKLLIYNSIDKNDASLNNLTLNKEFKERFLVKEGNQFIPIKIEDVAYFYWSDYAFLRKFDGKSYLINHSLNQLEELIPPHLFIRINRQMIANINAIESFVKREKFYDIKLIPKFPEMVTISKESYLNLKKILS